MIKSKILNIALVLSSLIGYLEWGDDNKSLLAQAEMEIIFKLFSDPRSILHPLILLPFFGQLILIFTLLQKKPGRMLTIAGILCIGILILLILIVGILSRNYKIVLSAMPFCVLSLFTIWYHCKSNK